MPKHERAISWNYLETPRKSNLVITNVILVSTAKAHHLSKQVINSKPNLRIVACFSRFTRLN